MQPFTERVVGIIRGIPAGRVMSYGQIAAAAGSPRAARQVVRILHSSSAKHRLPWHRVVNKNGEVAIPDDEGSCAQRRMLEEEGVAFGLGGRIDLSEYAHAPEADLTDEPHPEDDFPIGN